MSNRYVNLDQAVKNVDDGGLLVGNNAEWAKVAIYNADYIDLDYFIPIKDIDNLIEFCKSKIESYRATGSIAQVECYTEFLALLNSLWIDPEDRY
jgi:hypothetical protein